jgi:hypothetical protein
MRETITARLLQFERDTGATVILAVESGSRGWGFSSSDSDFDIRFIYKYPVKRYLNLQKPPNDVCWTEGELDFAGCDIYKFYDILGKSNMNFMDYLWSDIIYIDKMVHKEELKNLVEGCFNRRTYSAHNYGLAKKNFVRYFNAQTPDEPTVKRYVYCIRAILSAGYCERNNTIAPLKFDDLLQQSLHEPELSEMRAMVELKKNTKEKQVYDNPKWKKFIEDSLKNKIDAQPSDNTQFLDYLKLLNSNLQLQHYGAAKTRTLWCSTHNNSVEVDEDGNISCPFNMEIPERGAFPEKCDIRFKEV